MSINNDTWILKYSITIFISLDIWSSTIESENFKYLEEGGGEDEGGVDIVPSFVVIVNAPENNWKYFSWD